MDDVEPFEQRKLWLLNGSHSMLAYAGSVRGHETIDEAIADPACREWVELFWDEASRHLPFPPSAVADYRAALLTRFSNPHMRDQLARIAADGSTKLVVRTIPTVRAERAAGRIPSDVRPHLRPGCCTCGVPVPQSRTPVPHRPSRRPTPASCQPPYRLSWTRWSRA